MSIVSIDAAFLRDVGTVNLHTKRLTCRRFCLEDAPVMYENWAADPQVARFVTWHPHTDRNETAALLKLWVADYGHPHTYRWAIEMRETGQLIGSIDVVNFDATQSAAEIGFCSAVSSWNQGLMSEALTAVIDYLFTAVNVRRIFAKHDVENPASGRVMIKANMTFEGILSASFADKHGQLKDMAVYAIHKEQHTKHKLGDEHVKHY